jgi:hypothetical protein
VLEPQRNDPCPCGSGKKYKRCCLENPKVAAREATEATKSDPLETALTRFAELVERGRLPREILVASERFDAVVGQALSQKQEQKPPGVEALFAQVADQLWPEGLKSVVAVLERELEAHRVKERDLLAVVTAQTTAEVGPVAQNPVAEIIFRIQLRAWAREQSKNLAKMNQASARLRRLARKSGARLGAAIEAEVKALRPLAESHEGRWMLEKVSEQAAASLAKLIREGQGHPLLQADEWIWLQANVAGVMDAMTATTQPPPEASHRELAEAFTKALDEQLVTAVIERARELGSNEHQAPEAAQWYRAAEAAVGVDPAQVLFSSFLVMDMLPVTERDAEEPLLEAVLKERHPTRQGLEPYRAFLAAEGEAPAAARVERAQAVLG